MAKQNKDKGEVTGHWLSLSGAAFFVIQGYWPWLHEFVNLLSITRALLTIIIIIIHCVYIFVWNGGFICICKCMTLYLNWSCIISVYFSCINSQWNTKTLTPKMDSSAQKWLQGKRKRKNLPKMLEHYGCYHRTNTTEP